MRINKNIVLQHKKTKEKIQCALRNMVFEDINPLTDLTAKQWKGKEDINKNLLRENFESRLGVFPTGGLIVEIKTSGDIVGAINSLLIKWENVPPTWDAMTAKGSFRSHDPDGDTLVCPQVSVNSDCGLKGVSRALIDQQVIIAKKLGCKHLIAYSRPANFGTFRKNHGNNICIEDYLKINERMFIEGQRCPDTNIGMHMSFGAKINFNLVFPNSCPGDFEAQDYCVIMQYW